MNTYVTNVAPGPSALLANEAAAANAYAAKVAHQLGHPAIRRVDEYNAVRSHAADLATQAQALNSDDAGLPLPVMDFTRPAKATKQTANVNAQDVDECEHLYPPTMDFRK